MPDFEPARGFAYRFVRYTVLPEVANEVAALGDEPFLLREIAWPIIDRLLTNEQQAVRVPRAHAEGENSMSSIVRFYVSLLAKSLNLFQKLGGGYFRAHSEADISEDEWWMKRSKVVTKKLANLKDGYMHSAFHLSSGPMAHSLLRLEKLSGM